VRVVQIEKNNNLSDLLRRKGCRLSFSQFGEDQVLWSIFKTRKRLENGFFVDVGAHDPWYCSNTAMFYSIYGWRGINIDASKEAVEKFNLERPEDKNICAAVSDTVSEVDYVVFNRRGINTIDPAMREKQESAKHGAFKVEEVRKLTTIRLEEILDAELPENREIDLINIDVEGNDLRVLKSNNWVKYRPFIVAVEIHGLKLNNLEDNATYEFMKNKGYRLISHCFVTSMFMRQGPQRKW
jgi:FkbM family methyltransferase